MNRMRDLEEFHVDRIVNKNGDCSAATAAACAAKTVFAEPGAGRVCGNARRFKLLQGFHDYFGTS